MIRAMLILVDSPTLTPRHFDVELPEVPRQGEHIAFEDSLRVVRAVMWSLQRDVVTDRTTFAHVVIVLYPTTFTSIFEVLGAQ